MASHAINRLNETVKIISLLTSVVLVIHLLIRRKKKKYFDLNYLFTVEIDSNHPEERERERGNRNTPSCHNITEKNSIKTWTTYHNDNNKFVDNDSTRKQI
jgi:hypothetical protein